MSVTLISCLYGDRGFERFVGEWEASVRALTTRPHEVIVSAERDVSIPCAHVFVSMSKWKHPQAWYLQQAVELAQTEWVWILDMDDTALPDALDGIEEVEADVWQMGFHRSDGVTHISPQMTGPEYLAQTGNQFTSSSAFRVDAFERAGGFPDVAFQDWGLWRRMAKTGATFESSGRTHYLYNRHWATRTAVELTAALRGPHMEEMFLAS